MLAYRSGLDSGFLWRIHIHTHIRILTDSMDRPSTRGRHFTGTMGIAFLSRDILFTVFTTTIGKWVKGCKESAGLARCFFEPALIFFRREIAEESNSGRSPIIFPISVRPPAWWQGFCLAGRFGTLFSVDE